MLANMTINLVNRFLPSNQESQHYEPPSTRNAFLESLLIHARVLQEFLTAKPGRHNDDALATHFVPAWSANLRVVTGHLVTRMHKQLAHLSLERENKELWPVVQIADDVLSELRRFLTEARAHGYLLSEVERELDEWEAWIELEQSQIEDQIMVPLEEIYEGS